uniref:Uncharacterized protein n=1 Tax=Fluctibacter corallii TaxID=2984329 RepID=A0ABT3A7M2_9ALTE|nr:hypothetical protein [Aestuariibacter sp. AA17]MCV2884680.1 hypothetical protein [Aestuariibacter sp. AA17]
MNYNQLFTLFFACPTYFVSSLAFPQRVFLSDLGQDRKIVSLPMANQTS